VTAPVSRREALAVGASVAAGLLGHSASAAPVPKVEENKSWVGKTVLPKKPDPSAVYKNPPPTLPRPNNPDGTPGEVRASLQSASWEVKAEKGTRVEVIEDGDAFWIEKQELVLLADAVEFYTEALNNDARDTYAFNFRGWAKYLLGKPDDAIKDFDDFLKLAPAGPAGTERRKVGLSNRGLVLAEMGKFDDALKDLDEAVKLGHRVAQLNRGRAHELKGDYKKAAADYEELFEGSPRSVLVVNNLAWLRATCPDATFRDGQEAVRLAKHACDLTGNREGMVLDTLAAAHAEAGDFAAAVKAQELALADAGYTRKEGDDAQKRLQLYKDKTPYRSAPLK
jgi:tetratricopeptide (TPR) repeat protein